MNKKFVEILEGLDEAFKNKEEDDKINAKKDEVEKVCDCTGNGRGLKKSSHDKDCAAIKKGLVKEDLTEAEEALEEGRPKKEVDPNAKEKVAGKRGRPKAGEKDEMDDESKEGKRDLTLHAFIRGGKGKNKQEATESKTIKDAKVDDIKKLVQNFENVLTVKFANKWDFDESDIFVDVKDNLGWTGKRAEDMTKDNDGNSNRPEDDIDSEK